MARPQISLLTIAVAFLIAAVMLGINVIERDGFKYNRGTLGTTFDLTKPFIQIQERGWPCVYEKWNLEGFHHFAKKELALNVVLAIGMVVVVGGSVELWVRGRKT